MCGKKCCRKGEACNPATSTCACLGGGEYCEPLKRCCDPGELCRFGECVAKPCTEGKAACIREAEDNYKFKVEKIYHYTRKEGEIDGRVAAAVFALSGQAQSLVLRNAEVDECKRACKKP